MDKPSTEQFTDLLYAWLSDSYLEGEVIEGNGTPGHPVRIRLKLDDDAETPVEVEVRVTHTPA